MTHGGLVYIDGPDGVGKTTQLELAAQTLAEAGHKVHTTRCMGGTPIGEMLREAALSDTERPVETDLYIAMACHHALLQEVLPRRRAGEIILVDRSPISIIAYQVYGDDLDHEAGHAMVNQLIEAASPDLMIVYHTSDEELWQRRRQRNQAVAFDHFEAKSAQYHQRVARGFGAAQDYGATVIEAHDSIDTVHQATMSAIQKHLGTGKA